MDSKDTSATGRHGADLAIMRLGHELRRRSRDRVALREALRDAAMRMGAAAAMLWMPCCRLKLCVPGKDGAVSVPVGAEFDSIAGRIATLEETGQPVVFQGDDSRAERRAACRLIIVPMETGTSRFPAWLVFARELTAPRFNTWSAVLAQVQGLRLSRRMAREFDPATGHLSRFGLRTAIEGQARLTGSIILADLDGMRSLNHARGVEVGDEVIRALGCLLEPPQLPESALVSRLDGAKFAVLIPEVDALAAKRIAVDLQASLAGVKIKDHDDFPRLTVSCGVAEFDFSRETLNAVLLSADIVLRLAKERGRSRVEIHESSDASVVRRYDDNFAVAQLRDALRERQLELCAQPIVSLRDAEQPPGFELLLRLRGAEDDSREPGRLLAAAQRHQMLPTVDRYVVDHAFTMLSPHREVLARQRVTMAINISGQSISDPEFAAYFMLMLKKSNLPPACIVVEVTEQVAVGGLGKAADFMRRLRAAGCGIAIDDFGTGANSLAYVHKLPVTRLKIDGSFVRDITTNRKSDAAVRGIVQLARDFVLQTVGECVEDPEQAEHLRRLGVDFGQGYFFGRAESLDATIAALLRRESADSLDAISAV